MYYDPEDSGDDGYGYGNGPEDSGDDGDYAEDSGDEGFPTCHVCGRVFNRGNSWRDNDHARMQHMKTHDMSATCPTCQRVFSKGRTRAENFNSMEQHKMVHIERKVSCPVCGETRFRTSDGAVQHVESGACSGCRGQERARKNVYTFLNQQEMGRSLLNKETALEYQGQGGGGQEQPQQPWYSCPSCGKKFEQAGSLMQHARSKHGGSCDMSRALKWDI